MAEIDLRALSARTFGTADVLAASGVSLERFKQWAIRRIDFSDNPDPGTGRRRRFRLHAVYAYAGITTLTDQARLSVQDAARIMHITLYLEAFYSTNNISLDGAISRYKNIETWPYYMKERNGKKGWAVYAAFTDDEWTVWLVPARERVFTKDGLIELDTEPSQECTPRIKASVVLNLTDMLRSVDEILVGRAAVEER